MTYEVMDRDCVMFDDDLMDLDYHSSDEAAWYLDEACDYLAEAADINGWRGICIYATALLHYSLRQRYPEAVCDMVAGWVVSSVDLSQRKWPEVPPPDTGGADGDHNPYAHYWLELKGLNEAGEACVHRFDCAEMSRRLWTDPAGLLLKTAYSVQYHPARRDRNVLPAIYPSDLSGVKNARYILCNTDDFLRQDVGSTPERLIVSLDEEPYWRPGTIRQMVEDSDGLLYMPESPRGVRPSGLPFGYCPPDTKTIF